MAAESALQGIGP